MGQELRTCHFCGGDYLSGLFAAHRMLAHQPKGKDPNRIFSCAQCSGKYPASQRAEHLNSIEHRSWMMSNTDIDVIAIAEAYERGERTRDIQARFDIHPPLLYKALHIAGTPKRGMRTFPEKEVNQRGSLVKRVGDRWDQVRRAREQGISWAKIEALYS